MHNKANKRRRKHFRSVALVAKRTTRKRDVGKVPVDILNPNALGAKTQLTISPIQRLRNLRTSKHHQTLNPHLLTMSQKTNFATTPIQRTNICPTIHQIGPSNANLSSIQSAIDGLSLCCLASSRWKKLPSSPTKTPICFGNQFLLGTLTMQPPSIPGSGPFP